MLLIDTLLLTNVPSALYNNMLPTLYDPLGNNTWNGGTLPIGVYNGYIAP